MFEHPYYFNICTYMMLNFFQVTIDYALLQTLLRATQNNGERPTTSPFTPTTAYGRPSANNAPAINVNGPLASDGEWDFDCVEHFLESYEAQAEALANHMHEVYVWI